MSHSDVNHSGIDHSGVIHSGVSHSAVNPGMKLGAVLLATVIFAGPSIPYFKYQRPVQVQPGGQRFVAVDEQIWKNARHNLGDLRLYSGKQEVPYALIVERGSGESDNKDVRVLQQSVAGGKTQFMIDMTGVAEYDHIDLKLTTKNFVAHARVEARKTCMARSGRCWRSQFFTTCQKKVWAGTTYCGCRFLPTNICESPLMGR
jgi:hypothetical protein